MISVPTTAAMTVAENTAPLSMPASLSIRGFTARIYDMVRKVVSPANTSTFTECLAGSNPKIDKKLDIIDKLVY